MGAALIWLIALSSSVTPPDTIATSLPGRYLMNGLLVREVRLVRPCIVRIRTYSQTVEIDWTRSDPHFRTTDHNRKTIVDGHVFTTADQRAADRIEAAASRMADACHDAPFRTAAPTRALRKATPSGSR